MFRQHRLAVCLLIAWIAVAYDCDSAQAQLRPRVVVSTDIGGTDPDDDQSLVHLLVYADCLELEAMISSPYGPGRKTDILQVIEHYERDYPALKAHSDTYPEPAYLRMIAKQGETEVAPYAGFRLPTEGSQALIQCAQRVDPRPLCVLVWGGLEDLAQALHDQPDILPKLRVYWIGGPNKKWSPDAYQYLVDHHPTLWFIEANSTYRGWFTGGDQTADFHNRDFVARFVAGRGALGTYFATLLGGNMKMGDTPSVAWLLNAAPTDSPNLHLREAFDPAQPSWGGQFTRAPDRPLALYDRLTSANDHMNQFGILELRLPVIDNDVPSPIATMQVENQSLVGHWAEDSTVRFRFCPKDAKQYNYRIESNLAKLNGLAGSITADGQSYSARILPSPRLVNWWTDSHARQDAEGSVAGAKTVSQWRTQFLSSFAERMKRCPPK